nr:type II toxin-antitoxin system VapC family toxin [Aeromicrobium sp. CFBP 8757]
MVARDGVAASELLSRHRLTAPHLLDVEIVSAVRGLVLGRHLGAHRGRDVLDRYEDLPVTRWATADDLRRRAFELRDNFSAYDAAYVVLAEALDCPLATRDLRLARAAERLVDVLVA